MERKESILAQVERFEDYCLRKRSLEGDIESTLARIDERAVGVVERAEFELEKTKGECAEVEARFEKARRGDFEKAEPFRIPLESGIHTSLDVRKDGGAPEAHSAALANSAPNGPIQPEAVIPSSSISTSAADSDGFSMISTQPQGANRSTDQESSPDHSRDDTSDELLPLLVQRYTDLCHERRTLQEEIEERLERKERMAAERLRCAKIALETTRQRAVEIVAALNEASGGDTKINLPAAMESAKSSPAMTRREATDILTRVKDASGAIESFILPWQHEVEMEAYSTEEKSPRLAPSLIVSPAVPVPACPATVPSQPVPTIVSPNSTLTPNSFPLAARLAAVVAPTIEPLIPTKPAAITSPNPKPHKHQALLQRYEQRMNAAKSTADKSLKVSNVPWPVLHSQSPLHLTHPSLSTTTLQSNLQEFIHSYSQWKHSTFKKTSATMLSDWVLIVGKMKKKNKGGKQMGDNVIGHLRTFSK